MCQTLSLVNFIGLFGSFILSIAAMICIIVVVLQFTYKKEPDLKKLVKNLIPASILAFITNIFVVVSLISFMGMLIKHC